MKRLIITILGILFLTGASGCDFKKVDIDQIQNDNMKNDNSIQKNTTEPAINYESNQENLQLVEKEGVAADDDFEWCYGFSIPVPKPDSEYITTHDYGAICRGMNTDQIKDYLTELEVDNWNCIEVVNIDSNAHYTFTKDDMIMQIIVDELNQVETSEKVPTIENYIVVNFSYGYEKIKERVNTLSTSDAATLIEEYNKQLSSTNENGIFHGSKSAMILERFLEDSYEKMELQAYTVFNEEGRSLGNYLICNQKVLPVIDSLSEVCVADINSDGKYELLSLYGWGSGIYRIELTAYQYENPIFFSSLTKIIHRGYHNCFVPKNGYGKLSLKKISDTEVRLLDHDWKSEESDDYDGEPKDYGKIIVADDGYHLIPEVMEQFPYEQWDYAYDQETLLSQSERISKEKITALKEPPIISINVGEKEINYEVGRIKWNGEKISENINFSTIMKENEEIPIFDSPENTLEFNDTVILDFGDVIPDSVKVKDYLLSNTGNAVYTNKEIIDREVKIEEDGTFSFGLQQHFAMMLSSSLATYTNYSYRGFRVTCTFGDDKVSEYVFILMMSPLWND